MTRFVYFRNGGCKRGLNEKWLTEYIQFKARFRISALAPSPLFSLNDAWYSQIKMVWCSYRCCYNMQIHKTLKYQLLISTIKISTKFSWFISFIKKDQNQRTSNKMFCPPTLLLSVMSRDLFVFIFGAVFFWRIIFRFKTFFLFTTAQSL